MAGLTKAKAKKILSDGKIRGKLLTAKQKRFFGSIAGGQRPKRKGNLISVRRKR